jgi:hypothetical protein
LVLSLSLSHSVNLENSVIPFVFFARGSAALCILIRAGGEGSKAAAWTMGELDEILLLL